MEEEGGEAVSKVLKESDDDDADKSGLLINIPLILAFSGLSPNGHPSSYTPSYFTPNPSI